ncbi:longevity-assurance protein 1 [Myriangium duriaei CBS 260.36]|uniref:Longevity-assurance protein 1 n=1 Tax=Myriangium duriaei CBS 260.36 TaxID=1168546 RepID=A0A9P4IWX2_9PEZI|nr:longevity-assurance protein 1 [Myriangium duriaei CBS 260.36]
MSQLDTEPFPAAIASTGSDAKDQSPRPERTRPRRKSSRLGGEPRGDTGAAALATMDPVPGADMARANSGKLPRHSKRRKAKSLFRRWVRFSLRTHTWINPLIIVLLVLGAYALNPTESNPLHKAIFVSYPLPRAPGSTAPIQYGKGKADFAFVGFYTIVLTFTREFIMQRVIRPIALRWGIKSRAKQSRFMEQFYTAVYFSIMGPVGLWVMSRTPVWYFNTRGMFEGFPHRSHDAAVKSYYLLQASYWAQQWLVLLLMLEKPRKDFKELVLHHVITLALIWLSYRFHFTYMGVAVYVTHDISDFFLATSKVLNYIDSPVTIPYFVFFIGVWTYMRHYLNLRILYATATEFRTVGPFELNWDTQQYKCWISQYITFALLAVLQAVNLFWMFLILRILYRYAITKVATDDRSDSEEEDEDEQEEKESDREFAVEDSKDASGVRQRRVPNGKENGAPAAPQVFINGAPAVVVDEPVGDGKKKKR